MITKALVGWTSRPVLTVFYSYLGRRSKKPTSWGIHSLTLEDAITAPVGVTPYFLSSSHQNVTISTGQYVRFRSTSFTQLDHGLHAQAVLGKQAYYTGIKTKVSYIHISPNVLTKLSISSRQNILRQNDQPLPMWEKLIIPNEATKRAK